MEVRVKQESQDEALVPLCGKSNSGSNGNSSNNNNNNNSHSVNGSGINNPQPGPMQKVPSLSDLSDPESSLGKNLKTLQIFIFKFIFRMYNTCTLPFAIISSTSSRSEKKNDLKKKIYFRLTGVDPITHSAAHKATSC
jgi:hypothetical protein